MNLFTQLECDVITGNATIGETSDPFALTEKPTMTKTIHCFEAAGLGKAPFRYIGEQFQDIRYGNTRVIGNIGGCTLETKPGGTCDYCGTYIVNMFTIESADGNRFKVGCDCVLKTGDAGLIRKVDAAVKKNRKAREIARKRAQAQDDRELCETYQIGLLASKPHPHPSMARDGKTLADWAQWMLEAKNYATLAKVIRAEMKK